MTKLNQASNVLFWGVVTTLAAWIAVVDVGRLPQAAPSLSRSAPSLAARLGPNGLQSTIAGGTMNRRAQMEALERLNFARTSLGQMRPEQRANLTAERLVASYGVTPAEAAHLFNQYGWRR